MFLKNITKVRHFKRKTNFRESMNFFPDQGENNSDRHLMKLRIVKKHDKKVLYVKMLFIFILVKMILIVVVSK